MSSTYFDCQRSRGLCKGLTVLFRATMLFQTNKSDANTALRQPIFASFAMFFPILLLLDFRLICIYIL